MLSRGAKVQQKSADATRRRGGGRRADRKLLVRTFFFGSLVQMAD
jgi:hypothetical protein